MREGHPIFKSQGQWGTRSQSYATERNLHMTFPGGKIDMSAASLNILISTFAYNSHSGDLPKKYFGWRKDLYKIHHVMIAFVLGCRAKKEMIFLTNTSNYFKTGS